MTRVQYTGEKHNTHTHTQQAESIMTSDQDKQIYRQIDRQADRQWARETENERSKEIGGKERKKMTVY